MFTCSRCFGEEEDSVEIIYLQKVPKQIFFLKRQKVLASNFNACLGQK
jgi:hypothetical protein